MVKVKVDNLTLEVEEGLTVLQACEQAGSEIPRFCYHDRLSIAGNCRMCLVEVSPGPPKPQASCALPVSEGQIIKTNSKMVQNARKGVMEFLLINHPLDCPICDQGGECDLQDQAMAFGSSNTRYLEHKRAVKDKEMGPLIKTNMTRCIHCTRCVRFSTEVAGVDDLGAIGRGENMEISTYLEKTLNSELSACVIDLCPVGALTSKPYAFNARPWELTHIETIDVMDAVGSNIRVDVRGNQVLRVMPRLNEDINEEWISDKTRFAIDGLQKQRLDRPYIRNDNGKLVETDWDNAFTVISNYLNKTDASQLAALAGDLVDIESAYSLKLLMDKLECVNIDCRIDHASIGDGNRSSYLFNTGIAGIEEADALLIIGSNPRIEAAILNSRIRKRFLMGDFPIGVIGDKEDLTYEYEYFGNTSLDIEKLFKSDNKFINNFKKSNKPMIILGMGALIGRSGFSIIGKIKEFSDENGVVKKDWNGFNVLHNCAGRIGALDIRFLPGKKGLNTEKIYTESEKENIKFIWLLGVDSPEVKRLKKSFVVYQGHHGDEGANNADVILPGAAYTEKSSIYVNAEGRPQMTKQATFPPGEAREDWRILRAFSEKIGKKLPFDDLEDLRNKLFEEYPHLKNLDNITISRWSKFGSTGKIDDYNIGSTLNSFHMTCPISRSSETMAACINNKSFNKLVAE